MGKIEELNKELERIEMELQKGDAITPERKYYLLTKRERIKESMQPEIIDISDDDFGAILNCAVRYAMGRCTYMPSLVTNFILPLIPYINTKTLYVFRDDYESRKRYRERTKEEVFGDPQIDEPVWKNFYNAVYKELQERRDRLENGDDKPIHTFFSE